MNTINRKIALRAFTEPEKGADKSRRRRRSKQWPKRVLILDTETTTDPTQRLLFGSYQIGIWEGSQLRITEVGIFHADELEEFDPWQAFAAVVGKATGVKGDNRVHGWIVMVRSVESRDGMTARAQELDWDVLQRIQSRITGTLPNVSRVAYDVTHKPPATIEYE